MITGSSYLETKVFVGGFIFEKSKMSSDSIIVLGFFTGEGLATSVISYFSFDTSAFLSSNLVYFKNGSALTIIS